MQSITEYQQIILPVLKKYQVKRAAIFGSVAKGSATRNSDFDVLVETEPGFTLFKMLQLEQEIAELLRRKVDLVEFDAIKQSIKDEVLQSAVVIL